ncbi:MAG: ATP-binding cassette domain-containing protein [Gammaproteobacteria bacterium]|nr:ATP-binding cassette domain-containing protein [Gammaproteobacteria bacterium]
MANWPCLLPASAGTKRNPYVTTSTQQQDASTTDSFISLRDVVFRHDTRNILDGLNLDIAQGSVVAILGPSGVGKSTILKLITGQIRPVSGTITVNRQRVDQLSGTQLNRYRKTLGVMLQNSALLTDMTVFENVALPVREHTRLPEPVIRRLVLSKLQAVGLRGSIDMLPRELSGGMARRVALARALVLDPELVLYDEPFTGLDPIAAATVSKLIRHVNEALNVTSVVITHDVDRMQGLIDCAHIMIGGKIAASGTPAQLAADETPMIRQFMQGLADGPVPFHYPAPDLAEDLLQ